ncbi:zinc dependent phospholipase C [Mobilisporobacter senegalensis]|uniref:Zinc dependent phospholipase C n=1 Tax=Mobilisporobacter senegalensis TaxID=1329262 RepID=A0A3N1XNB1_9FIRM|nr:zinc dependent phospholipase C family protein [Mobilisporobacter senegalensis]ROR28183.1 zinc dependent phospholipase C [Mobilisporobacter senegalensis]
MRKKSHISLAKYIINNMHTEELRIHKKAFYIGSILPDCVPSFITRKHSIDETFHILREEIRKVTEDYDVEKGMNGYYCRHLGVITHYIADYFTFPHNRIFTGTLKEHCNYESDLKKEFKEYVGCVQVRKERDSQKVFHNVDDICDFILKMHEEYLNAIKVVKVDCLYIVDLCHRVIDAILLFFETMLVKGNDHTPVIA